MPEPARVGSDQRADADGGVHDERLVDLGRVGQILADSHQVNRECERDDAAEQHAAVRKLGSHRQGYQSGP